MFVVVEVVVSVVEGFVVVVVVVVVVGWVVVVVVVVVGLGMFVIFNHGFAGLVSVFENLLYGFAESGSVGSQPLGLGLVTNIRYEDDLPSGSGLLLSYILTTVPRGQLS